MESPSPVTKLGRVRWTICAMLFVVTSSTMDRQVIAFLKPTLQQSIGLTEAGYGNIVWHL
jgi:ACS family hexuronate transporter-like MFS transporter